MPQQGIAGYFQPVVLKTAEKMYFYHIAVIIQNKAALSQIAAPPYVLMVD